MGFYGNITNTSRTQFQFDKIYPNRKEMDINCSKDGVYLGRYVLIEYDDEYHLDTLLRVWIKEEANGALFAYNNSDFSGQPIKAGAIKKDEIVYTSESNLTPSTGLTPKDCKFYICNSTGSSTPATFKPIDGLDEKYGYTYNYNIDLKEYSNGSGRGYDSTVWQKTYTNGEEKYVMIAELNTVVPTFDVIAEAPSMNPVAPHFDTESTNVYYKLHWQTPWGFRIAQAKDEKLSDGKTTWTEVEYDPNTGTNIITESGEIDAAIYFNKDAFDAQVGESVINKKQDGANEIKVTLASSGKQLYDDHNPTTKDPVAANDIQEMSINLPAIGNMMSDAWDIIHGPNRDNAKNDSLQGRLDSFKALTENQIPIVNTNNEIIGAVINGGKTSNTILTGKNDDAWIQTKVDENNITIHHNTKDITENDIMIEGIPYATIKDFSYDDAGHITAVTNKNFNFPYGYGSISDGKDSYSSQTPFGVLTFSTGNKWLDLDISKDKVSFSHATPNPNNQLTPSLPDITLQHGDRLGLPVPAIDELGHVYDISTGYINMPTLKLTDIHQEDNFGNTVITEISLDEKAGDFTQTKANIGNLKISGYEPLYGSVADINEGDTLNIALAKLSNKVKDNSSMTNYVDEKLADLTVQHTLTDDRYISGISQQNGLIGITTKSLPTYSLTSGETNGTVKFNDKEIEITGLKSMAFENKEAFAPADILTTTRFDYSISATASASTQFTIQELCRKVASLEQEIDELKASHLTE